MINQLLHWNEKYSIHKKHKKKNMVLNFLFRFQNSLDFMLQKIAKLYCLQNKLPTHNQVSLCMYMYTKNTYVLNIF